MTEPRPEFDTDEGDGRWATRSSGQGTARRNGREGKREEGGEAADLLLELGELAALRLEGEDGPVDVRDLGLGSLTFFFLLPKNFSLGCV